MSLTRVYQQELKRTRQAVAHAVAHHWNQLPDYKDEQIDPFLNKVLPIVQAGQSRAVALTSAYMSRKLGIQPVGLDLNQLTGAAVRNGVDPRDVYSRPFTTVWGAIYTIGINAAVEKALNRLMSTAEMDVTMSARDASTAFAQNSDGAVAYFVRVADPSCCDFCQMIDGAKVFADDPAPLHNNCGCTVEPVSYDSSAASDQNDLTSFAAGSEFDDVKIEEHGELGPVITYKNYEFTGPQDLPASYEREIS